MRLSLIYIGVALLMLINNSLAASVYEGNTLVIPVAQMSQSLVDYYLPEIMAEVDREFSLQDDGRTLRKTREYGYSFFELYQDSRVYTNVPKVFIEVADLIFEQLGLPDQTINNVILSVYDEGYYLEPHVDVNPIDYPNYNFYFEENVLGIVIEPDPTGHLYFLCHQDNNTMPSPIPTNFLYELPESVGTIFCLRGKFRYWPYYHGVTPVSKRRISITFRTVSFDKLVNNF